MRTVIVVGNLLILGVNCVAILAVSERIISDPCNHMGFDPCWLWL